MTFDAYVPRPGFSVRPPDLPAGIREALQTRAPPSQAVERPVRVVDDPAPAGQRRRRVIVRRLAEIPVVLAGALLFAFLIKTFLVQAFYIPSASMEPALEIGDRVLVEKLTYRFRDPERGEIIVFERPGASGDPGIGPAVRSFFEDLGLVAPSDDMALIKRVLALPGETVEVVDGIVLIDGRPLGEQAVVPDGRSFPAFRVPADTYYLLGDNRGNSDDSRYSLGAVPREEVVGRAFAIVWPPGNAGVGLRTHYAGGEPTTDDDRSAPVISPPALPRPDDASEAPPP